MLLRKKDGLCLRMRVVWDAGACMDDFGYGKLLAGLQHNSLHINLPFLMYIIETFRGQRLE